MPIFAIAENQAVTFWNKEVSYTNASHHELRHGIYFCVGKGGGHKALNHRLLVLLPLLFEDGRAPV